MITVVIGITTYKRPIMLEAALRSLESLDTNACVHVLVADNDPSGRDGIRVSERMHAEGYKFPLASIAVFGQGFTYGRNAILEAALLERSADFVVTMDDDQLVEPQWLTVLLKIQADTGADIVAPAVHPSFEVPPPQWARRCKTYNRDIDTTGNVNMLYGDGGVLVSKSLLQIPSREWYDHSFALSGGADSELFLRLGALGARFARAAQAVIYERYPTSRVTIRWALQRAYRGGSNEMLIARKHGRTAQALAVEAIRIAGALLIAPPLALIYLGQPSHQVDALCKFARACGKITALFGFRYSEYTKIHGC